jgi:hypothetical protein
LVESKFQRNADKSDKNIDVVPRECSDCDGNLIKKKYHNSGSTQLKPPYLIEGEHPFSVGEISQQLWSLSSEIIPQEFWMLWVALFELIVIFLQGSSNVKNILNWKLL